MTSGTDDPLVARAVGGDGDALEELLRESGPAVQAERSIDRRTGDRAGTGAIPT